MLFRSSFLDSILSIQSQSKSVYQKSNHVKVENFYWSTDCPQLLIKQAHTVKKWFEVNPQLSKLVTHKRKSFEDREAFQNIVRNIIYPYWRRDIYQTKKASNVFFKEFDQWFFKLAEQDAQVRWREGLDFVLSSVNEKWRNYDDNGRPSGFVGFYSKWHKLN